MSLGAPQSAATSTPVDLILRLESAFDHPIEKVWPYILHWHLWVDEKEYLQHRVAGKPDHEGEIKRVSHFDSTGRLESSFHMKIIRIVPGKQLIYKILSPDHAFDAETGACVRTPQSGYEVFGVARVDGKTLVSLDVLAEIQMTGISEESARSFEAKYKEDTEKNWYGKYFPCLRRLLSS
jgi:uncharacterized protein YndB with AHSA1/START domain